MFEQLRQRLQRQLWTRASDPRQRRKSPANVPAWSESLEDRTLLSAMVALPDNVFVVNTLDDTVDANLGDGIAADANGNTSLRAAIMEANALDGYGYTVISLPSGHYVLNIAGEGEDAGATGDLDLYANIQIYGSSAGDTIIDAAGLDRVFDVHQGYLSLKNATVTGGKTDEVGGGIRSSAGFDIRLTDSIITDNLALAGGGIYSNGQVYVATTTISDNFAKTYGGGVQIDVGGELKVEYSTFSDNYAVEEGGAIDSHGAVEINGSTVSGNMSQYGGGIAHSGSEQLEINHSTIAFNEAGVALFDIGNYSGSGGGIYSESGAVLLNNSIVSGNTEVWNGVTPDDIDATLDSSSSYNIVGVGGGLTDGVNGNIVGVNDAGLAPLADNGGPTMTHALLADSPAIDAANPVEWVTYNLSDVARIELVAPTADQRGLSRKIDGNGDLIRRNDIGSFEFLPADTLVVDKLGDVEDDGDYSIGELTLGEALKLANETPGHQTIQFATNFSGFALSGTLAYGYGYSHHYVHTNGEELVISDDVTILGLGAGKTIIDGDDQGRIFRIEEGVNVTITDMNLMDGYAFGETEEERCGGAIYNEGNLMLRSVTIQANSAVDYGGGVYNSGSLNVINSTIRENEAYRGGGINNRGSLIVQASAIVDNRASWGGGVSNDSMRTALIDRSTISGNEALQTGGGIYNAADSVLAITASTIASNQAGLNGGGIYDASTETNPVTISGTIVADNDVLSPSATETIYDDLGPGIVSLGHNLVQSLYATTPCFGISPGAVIAATGMCPIPPHFTPLETDIVNVDARLAPLADNGGPTMTHALLADSPAINAGITSSEESNDQRGVQRDLYHDIGAHESTDGPRVVYEDNNLVIYGTSGDDTIIVNQTTDGFTVIINGQEFDVPELVRLVTSITIQSDTSDSPIPETVSFFIIPNLHIDGGLGNDTLVFNSSVSSHFYFDADGMTLIGSRWSTALPGTVYARDIEDYTVNSTPETGGRMYLYGTDGVDTVILDNRDGSFENDLYTARFNEFDHIKAANFLTNDLVRLYESRGDDELIVNMAVESHESPWTDHPYICVMRAEPTPVAAIQLSGDDYSNIVYGTARVEVKWKNSIEFPNGGHTMDQTLEIHDDHDTAVIYGTDADETFFLQDGLIRIRQGNTDYTIYAFDDVTVNSKGGNDHVYLDGSKRVEIYAMYPPDDPSGGDTFTFKDGVGTLRSSNGFSATINDTEMIDVYSKGGNDRAYLYDTDGDDTFVSTANDARMFGADGSKVIVHEYPTVYALSENGGYDTALFYDSPENDTFVANPFNVRMERTGFYHNARNFDKAIGYAWNGGYDTAYLHDSAGNDTFVASPNRARMEGDNYGSYTYGFEKNLGFALNGGVDTAYLHDSTGDDAFVAHPHHARLTGDGFYNSAQSFETVTGFALNGGNDTATLHDSAGDDSFTVKPAQSTMTGDGYRNSARDFESTTGLAINGGIDAATFYDTAGDDDFISSPTVARMNTGGIKREAKNFELVNAYATAGGNDNAYLYGSPSGNSFYSSLGYNRFVTATSEVRNYGFEQTIAFGSIGNDVATFYGVRDGDYTLGRDDSFLLRRSDGTISRVVDFDSKDDRVHLFILRENNPVLDVDTESIDYTFETQEFAFL